MYHDAQQTGNREPSKGSPTTRNPNLLSGPENGGRTEELKEAYRAHRVYLNTDPQGRLHLSTLEAMATGMPLVSPPIADLAPHVEDGVSAFMDSEPRRLRDALEALLADGTLARQVGEAGREIVERHFGLPRFLTEWETLLSGCCKQSSHRRLSASFRPRRLRIAINAGSVGTAATGIGRYIAALTNAVAATGGEHTYYFVQSRPPRLGELEGPNARSIVVRPEGPLWEHTSLPMLLEEYDIDVYHNPAFGLPVVKPCRFVATVHDCIPRLFAEHSPGFLREFFERWAPV